jgi:hypothetical protein
MKLILKTMCGATKVVEHYDPYYYQVRCFPQEARSLRFQQNGYVRGEIREFHWLDGKYEWAYDEQGQTWYCPVLYEQPSHAMRGAASIVTRLEGELKQANTATAEARKVIAELQAKLDALTAPKPSRNDTVLDIAARLKR